MRGSSQNESAEQPACRELRVLRKLGTNRNPLLPPLERVHTAAAVVLVICQYCTNPHPSPQALDDCKHLTTLVLPLEQ